MVCVMRFDKDALIIDLELTSHCNARCSFCPRDNFAKYGRMSFETYQLVIDRVKSMRLMPTIHACGIGGDASLHPDLVQYVQYASNQGIGFHLTTNGSLIDRNKGRALVGAGLLQMEFSANCIGEEYEQFYGLPFDILVKNVQAFLEESDGRCRFQINLSKTKNYQGGFKEEEEFWRSLGVKNFLKMEYSNRVIMNSSEEKDDIIKTHGDYLHFLSNNGLDVFCPMPIKIIVINWRGQYLLCTHDYTRSSVLGNVFENSVSEIQSKKLSYMMNESEVCRSCSVMQDIYVRSENAVKAGEVSFIKNIHSDIMEVIRLV